MKIRQLLKGNASSVVLAVSPSTTLAETAQKLVDHKIGALVVTDQNARLVGIVSERDLVHTVANYSAESVNLPVSTVMTRSVITCGPDDEIAFILRLMNTNGIRHIPILEHEKLINMISIRELTRAYELLQIEANTDPLTELSNRRPFLKNLTSEFERARRFGHPLTVAMVDIDHFKLVNDTYGHDAGDAVLRVLSGTLISEFRTIDLIGRLGGEEFAVVFPETSLAGAKIAFERWRKGIQKTKIPVGEQSISITASIGIAAISENTKSGTDILKRADELLYEAKTGGRNRVVVDPLFSDPGFLPQAVGSSPLPQ